MIRYHVIEKAGSLLLVKSSISLDYAKAVRRRLRSRYPDKEFKIVASDVWNNFLRSLDLF